MSLPVSFDVDGWEPPKWPSATGLSGARVTVSALAPEAFDGLWDAFSEDPGDMWTYMGYGPFRSQDEMVGTVSSWVGSRDPMFFTFDVDGVARGWGAYLRINPGDGTVEIGHLAYSPALRRTTAATEVIYLMLRHVFDLGYRRCEWKCDSLNGASRSAAERLGFTYEGTFRRHMVYKGRNRDTAWYSIVDADWPGVRAALEEWLAPSNFDSDGHQLTPLATP